MSIVKRELKRPNPETGRKVAYLVRVEGKRDSVTGKRKQFSEQVGTLQQAKQLEAEWTARVARGTAIDPQKMTVSELLDEWLKSKSGSISMNSYHDYESAIRLHLKPVFGTIKVQALTHARIEAEYAKFMADGMSPRMVHRCHIILSQALGSAVRFDWLSRNVSLGVTKPRLSRGKPSVWTPAEVSSFLGVAVTDGLNPLWHLLALEGMRRGEALGLRWQDVNWERGAVHISQTVAPDKSNRGAAIIQNSTKTNTSARTVKLSRQTLEALTEHRDRQRFIRQATGKSWHDHDLIVCTSIGTPINPNNVTRSYNRLVIEAGVQRIRVHDLRHTAATLLLRAGVPAKIVSERLGHASVGITMDLYSHVLPDMQDLAANAMSEMMDRVTGTDTRQAWGET
jgi:integrase